MSLKDILVKLFLTIPALIVGIIACLYVLLKPTIELWFPKPKEEINVMPDLDEGIQENHTFM